MRSIISFYKEDTLGLAKIAHMATHYKVYSNESNYEGSFSAVKLPSDESNSWIKLCMTSSAAGILACTLGEYAGGKIKIQNLCLSIPKICSMTLWADEWWRLKSSSLLAGLCIYKYQIKCKKAILGNRAFLVSVYILKYAEFWILLYLFGNRIISSWKFHIMCIECWWGENVNHFLEITRRI